MKTNGLPHNISRLLPIFVMTGLLILCFAGSCRRNFDSRLVEADSKMEAHPDSALMLLEDYQLSASSSSADSAYYGLLLTHARYKNFIDETDDSPISVAAEHFLDQGDKERASRALFLQGVIQLNSQHLGEAAVSFMKGLDIAREGKCYMWEGQCARSLYKLYGELHDGSAQVNYARQALDAFERLGDKEWISTSKYALAVAYNNNCRYEQSLSILNQLEKEGTFAYDSVLLSHIYSLKGLSLYALNRYKESLESYEKGFEINSSVLCDDDIINIQVAQFKLQKDSISWMFNLPVVDYCMKDLPKNAFSVYAAEGRYKDAYESIEAYKNRQDSVISMILKNNVSESVDQYEYLRRTLLKKEVLNERMSYWMVIMVITILCILVVWSIREKLYRVEKLRLKTEADMESLRSDLLSQLDAAKMEVEKTAKKSRFEKTLGFEKIIRQHYIDANKLCDDYYQRGLLRKNGIYTDIDNIIRSFTEKESLEKIAEYVDEKSGSLYSSFKKDYFHLSADYQQLFLYVILGLSPRTLSVILHQNISAIYTKKSRLKSKIEQSDVIRKKEYLSFF